MSPDIAVVMPFHIQNKYLLDALTSVQNLSGPNVEIICVADGLASSEISSLAHRFSSDDRIRIISNSGKGLVDALNTGIGAANAPLIARMDSDDLFFQNRLELQKRYLDSHPLISVVGGQLIYVCAHDTELGKSHYPRQYKSRFGMKPVLPRIAHPASMFRKSVWQATGGYRSTFPHVEDLDFWNRCLEVGPIHNLKQVVLKYRIHPGQISNTQATAQKSQALKADLYDLLGEVPLNLDEEKTVCESAIEILKTRKNLPIRKRIALRHILGFFAVRQSLADFGEQGGLKGSSPDSRKMLFQYFWFFKGETALLAVTLLLEKFRLRGTRQNSCARCDLEK